MNTFFFSNCQRKTFKSKSPTFSAQAIYGTLNKNFTLSETSAAEVLFYIHPSSPIVQPLNHLVSVKSSSIVSHHSLPHYK